MDLNWFVLGILVVLLLGQQAYWSFIVFKLNDRLMSRSFSEYAHGEQLRGRPLKVAQTVPDEPATLDPIAEENAKRANSLFC